MFRKIHILQSGYFGSSGGSSPVSDADRNNPSTVKVPHIQVLTIQTPDTEQAYTLPAGTKWFSIINHSVPILKLAYVAEQSASNFREIPRGCSTAHPLLDSSASIIIYYQASTAGGRLEIESWS